MPGFIERDQWNVFLDEFSKRNQLRASRLEIVGEMGAQKEAEFLPFAGVAFEPKGAALGSVEIILGGQSTKDSRHAEHLIPKVQKIAPLIGPNGLEEGVGFEDQEGTKTLLIFEQLPEIPERTSTTRGTTSPAA